MKVKIVRTTPGYWYCVGEVWEVSGEKNYQGYYLCPASGLYAAIDPLDCEIVEDDPPIQQTIDKHYSSFSYTLKDGDVDAKSIKTDPYFVSTQWQLGKKDDSGVLFHILKTIARFGEKNSREREIVAIYKQIKRLAELEGVELN